MAKRLTGKERVVRDAEVVLLREQGKSWTEISKAVGITDRQCRTVYTQWREEAKLDVQGLDPLDVAFEQIARLDNDIAFLSKIAHESENDNAKVGAINAKARLYTQQVELLMAVGKMPKNLGKLAVELEANFVFRVVDEIIDEYVPAGRRVEAEDKLRKALRRERPKLQAVS